MKFLTVFTSGSLNLQQRDNSLAKNMLWELELWSILRRRSFSATLREPPDIVVIFEGAMVGIACKKLYSENNVEKVLSEAVGQIEAVFDYGIVAVNLDDLILPDQILNQDFRFENPLYGRTRYSSPVCMPELSLRKP